MTSDDYGDSGYESMRTYREQVKRAKLRGVNP